VGTMDNGKQGFKILMWGPEGPINVWTVSDHRISDIVEEAIVTIKNSRLNEFVGFSVMRNMTQQELETLSKHQEEKLQIIK